MTGPLRDGGDARAFGPGDIADIRHAASARASDAGLNGTRRDDFVLALDEMLTNAVRHGGGSGHVEIWAADGHLWFQVTDKGTGGAVMPAAPPGPTQPGGRGLWIARQVSDELTVDSGRGGTRVVCGFRVP